MWLAVSGRQPLFTLGLPMFALSLEHCLCRGAPVPTLFFHLCKNIIWRTQTKIFKIFHACIRLGFVGHKMIRLPLWCPLWSNILVASQWPLKRAPHMQVSVWYEGLEAHWSYLRYETWHIFAFKTSMSKLIDFFTIHHWNKCIIF